jgi:hypothetical protein
LIVLITEQVHLCSGELAELLHIRSQWLFIITVVDYGTVCIGGCQLEAGARVKIYRRFEIVNFDVDFIGVTPLLLRRVMDGEGAIGAIELLFCDRHAFR